MNYRKTQLKICKFVTKMKITNLNFKKLVTDTIVVGITALLYFIDTQILVSNDNVTGAWVQFIPLAISAFSAISGAAQKSKANRLERQNQLPTATANANIAKNQALANALSKQGLPAPVYNNQLQQMQQGLATGLRQGGNRQAGGLNANAFLRNYNQGLNNLNAQDASAQMNNQRLVMQTNSQMAQEEQRVWNWNQAQPYLRNANNISQLRQAGNQNIISGISGAGQSLMMMGGGGGYFGGMPNGSNAFQNAQLYGANQGMIA